MPDTSGAREDLRVARQYIEKYKKEKDEGAIGHAFRYVQNAREKDPNATLQYKRDKKVLTATADRLEAEINFLNATDFIYEEAITDSIVASCIRRLRDAIELDPLIPAYYKALSDTYMLINNKQDALATLQEARERFPDDFYTRAAFDKLSEPEIPVPESPQKLRFGRFAISMLFGFAFLGFSIFVANYESSHPDPIPKSPEDVFIGLGYLSRFALIICFIVAFFNRPRIMPEELKQQ
jgi:hypothetical protein